MPKNTPATYTTVVVGRAFLRAFQITKKAEYLKIALESRRTILEKIGYDDDPVSFWYSQFPGDKKYYIHNINSYVILFLSELGRDKELVTKAFSYEEETQRPNGNWLYFEGVTYENDLVHWAMEGESFYRAYEKTKEQRFLDSARKVTKGVKEKFIRGSVLLDDTPIEWGRPEAIVLFLYAFKLDQDKTLEQVLPSIQAHSNPRTNSWIAYSLALALKR